MVWEKSEGVFLESDVVGWIEAIWPPSRSRRRKRSRPWGKQKVVAQIESIEGEFARESSRVLTISSQFKVCVPFGHACGTAYTE